MSTRSPRRLLLVLLAALGVTAAICAVDPRGPTPVPTAAVVPSAPPPTTAPTSAPAIRVGHGCGLTLGGSAGAVGRCTVLEVGDSLGNDLGWGLAREVPPASGLTLVQRDRSASGLAHPSFYDWPAQLPAMLAATHPQLVLISLGGDDLQGMEVDGRSVEVGTAAWTREYVARVHRLASEATEAGAFVLWVGMPVMRPATYDRGMAAIDDAVRAGLADLPTARFVPTRALFATASGAYRDGAVVGGRSAGLREPDGIHLSLVGEDVVATYVLQQLATLYGVTVTPLQPAVITG